MKPNRERLLLWIEALESGEYKQIRHRLSDGKGYCAIGVAMALSEQINGSFLTEEWYGVALNTSIRVHGRSTNIVYANDTLHATFSEIAAALREKYGLPKTWDMAEVIHLEQKEVACPVS